MSKLASVVRAHRSAVVTGIAVLTVVSLAIGGRALMGPRPAEDAAAPADQAADAAPARKAAALPASRAAGAKSSRQARSSGRGPGAGAGTTPAGTATATRSGTDADAAAAPDRGRAPAPKQADASPRDRNNRVASSTTRTPLPGVTDDEITVVYYWKGDRTRTSPYLRGSGAEANVDEAEAFRKLVDYINSHADGGGTIMGRPFNLHGRTLKAEVVDAGQDPESYAAAAEKITGELRPFAAIAAHGSVSTYLCPALAKAGIHNFATYDLSGGLAQRSGGYCVPGSITWERQVALTEAYLRQEQRRHPEKVFGVVYTEYPGLVDSAPRMVERLRAAGVNVAATASLSASLSTAQQQAPNVVGQMRGAFVDTIVMPDAGAPLNFTHAAQAQGYSPDYYVWPCSGQDTVSMARLFNTTQWHGASGLTCYDEEFSSDLTHNTQTRATEWYAAYQEAAPGQEPPSPTPFVYAALLPLVAGITEAGPDLTLETFRAGLSSVKPYRYDAVEGRTSDPSNMLLSVGSRDRSFTADVAKLRFNAGKRAPGAATLGTYEFPERRRYGSATAI